MTMLTEVTYYLSDILIGTSPQVFEVILGTKGTKLLDVL